MEIKSDKEYNDAFYPGQYYDSFVIIFKVREKINRGNESFDGTQYFCFIMDYERLQKDK